MAQTRKQYAREHHQAAVLTHTAGAEIISRLDLMATAPKRVIELSCGTGQQTVLLKKRYAEAQLYALDASLSLLKYAKEAVSGAMWLNSTAENLPFLAQSVDIIIANLSLPWCLNVEKTLFEWLRVLRPNGLLMFSSLGPDTLSELNSQCLVPAFMDMHNLGDLLMHCGFSGPVMDRDYFTLKYKEQEKMWHELLITRMVHEKDLSTPTLSVTYEVIFGHAFAPESGSNKDHGTIKIPISHIMR